MTEGVGLKRGGNRLNKGYHVQVINDLGYNRERDRCVSGGWCEARVRKLKRPIELRPRFSMQKRVLRPVSLEGGAGGGDGT